GGPGILPPPLARRPPRPRPEKRGRPAAALLRKVHIMATLFKPTRPYPLPESPEILDRDGKPHVRVKEKGKAVLYPLTKDGAKYLKPAAKWYAKYRDAASVVRLVPLSPSKDAARLMLSDLLKRVENE